MVLDICAKSFQNVTNPSRVIERTHNTVIQCITLNYSLDDLGQTYALNIDSSCITFQTAMIPHTYVFTKVVMRENVKISGCFKKKRCPKNKNKRRKQDKFNKKLAICLLNKGNTGVGTSCFP